MRSFHANIASSEGGWVYTSLVVKRPKTVGPKCCLCETKSAGATQISLSPSYNNRRVISQRVHVQRLSSTHTGNLVVSYTAGWSTPLYSFPESCQIEPKSYFINHFQIEYENIYKKIWSMIEQERGNYFLESVVENSPSHRLLCSFARTFCISIC